MTFTPPSPDAHTRLGRLTVRPLSVAETREVLGARGAELSDEKVRDYAHRWAAIARVVLEVLRDERPAAPPVSDPAGAHTDPGAAVAAATAPIYPEAGAA